MPLFIFDSEGGLSTEGGKEFMVYELDGWSQKELYDKVILGISQLFTYPDKVMTKVENGYFMSDEEHNLMLEKFEKIETGLNKLSEMLEKMAKTEMF